MSFGATSQTKQAMGNLGTASGNALNLFPTISGTAQQLTAPGLANITSGTNFLNTILGGNAANTAALLAPDINRIRQANMQNLTAINTLMPRSGGRFGALFGQSLAPTGQIQDLFNNARIAAATGLPQLGLSQIGAGTNLFNVGNQALGTAGTTAANLADISQRQQQMGLNFWGNLGSGLLGLATVPFGGANKSVLQRL